MRGWEKVELDGISSLRHKFLNCAKETKFLASVQSQKIIPWCADGYHVHEVLPLDVYSLSNPDLRLLLLAGIIIIIVFIFTYFLLP